MNLYEIDCRIMEAFESAVDPDTGEIVNEAAYEALNELQMEFDRKAEGLLLWIKNLGAEAEALKKEKQSFEARQKAAENKAESLKRYVSGFLRGQKFRTERVAVSWRKSDTVEVWDLSSVPDEYLKHPAPVPDKVAIKAALKSGEEIPGAVLMTKQNMQIK